MKAVDLVVKKYRIHFSGGSSDEPAIPQHNAADHNTARYYNTPQPAELCQNPHHKPILRIPPKRNTSLNIPPLLGRSKTQTPEADATKNQQRNPPPLKKPYDRSLRNETGSWVIRTLQTNLNPQTFEKSSGSADIPF